MAYSVTFIPGDGIGPEVTAAARRVLEATGVAFRWDIAEAGADAVEKYGTPLPEPVIESIRKNKIALKGPITTPVGSGFRSVNVALRKVLDLYACVRPCKTYPGVSSLYRDVDIVVVRENTEDLYVGVEFEKGAPETARLIRLAAEVKRGTVKEDSGISLKAISETGSRKIVKFAFEYARTYQRKKVTALHKANILKFSDGLFLAVAREVAMLVALQGHPNVVHLHASGELGIETGRRKALALHGGPQSSLQVRIHLGETLGERGQGFLEQGLGDFVAGPTRGLGEQTFELSLPNHRPVRSEQAGTVVTSDGKGEPLGQHLGRVPVEHW